MDPLSNKVHPSYLVSEHVHSTRPLNMHLKWVYDEFGALTHDQTTKPVSKKRNAQGLPPDVDGRVPNLLNIPLFLGEVYVVDHCPARGPSLS